MLRTIFNHRNRNRKTNKNSIAAQLPPELIILILQHSLSDLDDLQYRARYSLLYCISQLCRSWGHQARLLLWSRIIIMHDREGGTLLKSRGFGRYSTEYISISGLKVMPNTTALILKRTKGVKRLVLSSSYWYPGLHEKPLYYENLQDLEVLELQNVILHKPFDTPPPSYLQLRRLEITTRYSLWSTLPLSSNFFGLHCSAITELKIHHVGQNVQAREIVDFLNLVAKDLRVFILIVPTIEPLLPALKRCAKLIDFTISFSSEHDLPLVLRALSCSLRGLTIRTKDFGKEGFEVMGLLSVLRERSLREIEVIRFEDYEEADFIMRCGGDEVLRKLRRKGVRAVFGSAVEE